MLAVCLTEILLFCSCNHLKNTIAVIKYLGAVAESSATKLVVERMSDGAGLLVQAVKNDI